MKNILNRLTAGRLATQRRKKGLYDHETYALYESWASLSLKARVEWYKYSFEYQGSSPAGINLCNDLPRLASKRRMFFDALNCCLADGLESKIDERILILHYKALFSIAEHSPAISAWLMRRTITPSTRAQELARIDQQQDSWRRSFIREVLDSRNTICVVGNAAVLEGRQLASDIDQHDFVFRFNHFLPTNSNVHCMERHSLQKDAGSRLSGWIASPDLSLPFFATRDTGWVFLSGPDIRYRLFHWDKWLPFVTQGVPVITFPIMTWTGLVQKLKGPPSAGLLFLAWILENAAPGVEVSIAGFQIQDSGTRYHLALRKHKATTRHHWYLERAIIRSWIDEGRIKVL